MNSTTRTEVPVATSTVMNVKVLLVEPWFGGSHRAWAEGYAAHSAHEVEMLTLPDRAWRWRMRGSALSLAGAIGSSPDVLLASSLLDVPAFLGHARRHLAHVPVGLYMHENQLTYPLPPGARRDTSLALVNWSSMAAADGVAFNSEFHRDSWFDALRPFLDSFPEPGHGGHVDGVLDRSTVLPVGVDMSWIPEHTQKTAPPLIMWNQRWEHDKDPDAVVVGLQRLAEIGIEFRVALCGESPHGTTPESFLALASVLGDRLVHMGYAPSEVYRGLLVEASVVISTARHEFFGVAVVEAIAAGAHPIVPNRLSYPEIVGAGEPFLYETPAAFVDALAGAVAEPDQRLTADVRRFSWPVVAPAYDAWLASLV